jgi:hypothetical protein
MGWRRIWTCGSEATQEGAHNRKLGALHCLCGYITMYNLSSSHLIESDTIGRFGAALACSGIEVPSIDRRKLPIGRAVPSLGLSTLTKPSYSRLPPSHTAPRFSIPCSGSGSQHGGADTSKRTHAHAHARTCKRARAHAHARTRPDTRARAQVRVQVRPLTVWSHVRLAPSAIAARRRALIAVSCTDQPTAERAQVRFLCAELSSSPLA